MIMWRSRSTLAALVTLVLLVPSCGPSLGDIRVSDCMKVCNDTSKGCLDKSQIKLESCVPDDRVCQATSIHDTEMCLTTCLDCIDQCVADMENTLKK